MFKYLHSVKHRRESRERLLATNSIIHTCPHCGITGRGAAMKRYHFENCKKVKDDNYIYGSVEG